eukprot:gene10291-2439_t
MTRLSSGSSLQSCDTEHSMNPSNTPPNSPYYAFHVQPDEDEEVDLVHATSPLNDSICSSEMLIVEPTFQETRCLCQSNIVSQQSSPNLLPITGDLNSPEKYSSEYFNSKIRAHTKLYSAKMASCTMKKCFVKSKQKLPTPRQQRFRPISKANRLVDVNKHWMAEMTGPVVAKNLV